MPRKTIEPKYLKHKASGSAYTYHRLIATKDHRMTLGRYGSMESRRRFQQVVAEIRAAEEIGNASPVKVVLSGMPRLFELALAYDEFSREHYQREGERSSEYDRMWYALQKLLAVHGDEVGALYGPKKLKEFQRLVAASGLSRSYTKQVLSRVKRFFAWCVSEELIPPSVSHGLSTVKGLRRGQFGVRETPRVRPAPLALVKQVLPFVSPVIGDMMQVQYFCAMRPKETCIMRPCDLDRSRDIWLYTPARHKTDADGRVLVKAIPVAAQSILAPRLERDPQAYLFPPAEGHAWRYENPNPPERKPRKTKRYPCEERRTAGLKEARKSWPRRKEAGPHYKTASYRKAIESGIERAEAAGVQIEPFTPNRLRHAIITFISREIGAQPAQRYAGHDDLNTTQIYTEKELAEMIDVARQLDAIWTTAS